MRRKGLALFRCLAVGLLISACSGSDSSSSTQPSQTPPSSSPSGAISVTGSEKVAWDQAATDASQLTHYHYLGYVDDAPQVLANANCGSAQSGGTFPCTASLPAMSLGMHRFEMAVEEIDGARRMSPRSPALTLNVVSSKTATTAFVQLPRPASTFDAISLIVETLTTGLQAPSALTVAKDGRLFVAVRNGRVLVWQNGAMLSSPALELSDIAQTTDVGLIDLALDPDFTSNGRAFAAYAARDSRGGFVNRVVRLREANGTLGEPTVILEDAAVLAPQRPPRIRVAADHSIYVAFAPVNQSAAENAASYSGKILRINGDGSTPRDNPSGSPIISSGEAVTGGFDWQPSTGRLWVTGRDWHGRDFLRDFLLGSRSASTFESPVDPSGAAFYANTKISGFANDMFIAALNGRHLRRVHFAASDPARVEATERLLDGQYGRISDVAVGADGALYVCTSNAGTISAAADGDRLIRISNGP